MAKLDIHVGTKTTPAQTTSVYRVGKNDHVTFFNEGPATLTVTFLPSGSTSPLCDNPNGPTPNPLTIPAGGNSGNNLKVCNDFNAAKFAYSAQVEGFAAEDPIVIIEQPSGGSLTIDYYSLIGGVILGALVTLGVQKLSRGGKSKSPG